MNSNGINNHVTQNRSGIVLLVTLVLLVVLSTLGYTLSSRLSAQRHRDQYVIDYSKARYGCDSAVKYAFATLEDIQPELISRPDETDFSDLFALGEVQYQELIAQQTGKLRSTETNKNRSFNDVNNVGDINDINDIGGATDVNNINPPTIRGPYGPAWPFVTNPVEFEIGSATVKIEIEDENAKYPVGWALLDDKKVQREAKAALDTFCDWMDVSDAPDVSLGENLSPRDLLKQELTEISKVKPFKLEFEPITRIERTTIAEAAVRRARRATTSRARSTRRTIPVSAQIDEQADHFSKLLHSSLFGRATELLARPIIISESRKESALKYMGMWGSSKVNVNTAPRQVLEAAFAFGGPSDAPAIAEAIIQRRRIKPFEDIEDLRKALFSYSDSVGKCEKYITTTSSFFTIKVTATSGVAEASSVIAVTKEGKTLNRIAVISD
jgi:Tfp pilus assembly protein PilX